MTSGPSSVNRAAYQTSTQSLVFRHLLTDSTISALPLLRVSPPLFPPPQVLLLFSFSGSFLWWGSTPRKMLSLAVCSCKEGQGGLRRHKASCRIPLPPCKGFNPSPPTHIKESILKGSLREVRYTPAFYIVSVLAAKVGSGDLIDSMISREKCGHTQNTNDSPHLLE